MTKLRHGLLMVIALWANTAMAVEPQDCMIGDGPRPYAGRPEPLGGGMVLQQFLQGDGAEELNVSILTLCGSGERIEAVTMDGGVAKGSHLEVRAIVETAIAAEAQLTMVDLQAFIEAAGTPTVARVYYQFETCPCAAFYPELRGDKIEWSAE